MYIFLYNIPIIDSFVTNKSCITLPVYLPIVNKFKDLYMECSTFQCTIVDACNLLINRGSETKVILPELT